MATKYWNPYGVGINLTATGSSVKRTSSNEYTVYVTASWKVSEPTNSTNYGMNASSGRNSVNLNPSGTYAANGSKSFTGTYSISGYGAQTKTVTVTFTNYAEDWQGNVTTSSTEYVSFDVWVPALDSYTVSYNLNGGTGDFPSQTKYYGVTINVPTTEPTREGYTFQGWGVTDRTDIDEKYKTEPYYSPNEEIWYNGNQTLIAIWKANTYTVTYNVNGGAGTMSQQSHIYDTTKNLTANTFTRTGYTFANWNTKKDGTGTSYNDKASVKNLSSTSGAVVTLYAQWTPINYTLVFDANGGTVEGAKTYNYEVPYEYPLSYGYYEIETLPAAVRVGYSFIGWNIKQDGSGLQVSYDTKMGQGLTVYAQWEPEASLVTLYISNENGVIRKRRGMVHMYNNEKQLCFAILTIYDKNGIGHLVN